MDFKIPKDNDKYSWTKHSIEKMKFYGLSAQRVLRVVNKPERTEEAVAPGCLAGMQSVGNKKKTEIWVMWKNKSEIRNLKFENNLKTNFKKNNQHKLIITAWRYPGVSPVRSQVPIPRDILNELPAIISN